MDHTTIKQKPNFTRVGDHSITKLIQHGPVPDVISENFIDNVNGFSKNVDIQNGKVIISLSKTLGSLDNEFATISIKLQSTSHRAPTFNVMHLDNDKIYVEIDDKKNRLSKSFSSEDQYYNRDYRDSSVLTAEEFIQEIIPSLDELVKDTKTSGYITKISKEVADVKRDYKREYVEVE